MVVTCESCKMGQSHEIHDFTTFFQQSLSKSMVCYGYNFEQELKEHCPEDTMRDIFKNIEMSSNLVFSLLGYHWLPSRGRTL